LHDVIALKYLKFYLTKKKNVILLDTRFYTKTDDDLFTIYILVKILSKKFKKLINVNALDRDDFFFLNQNKIFAYRDITK